MPKVYSEEEKKKIIQNLKYYANELLQEKGVKKTTVDELVKRAGIPKGTFYLFYPSKEMLLFEVTQDFHEQVDAYISDGIMEIMRDKGVYNEENLDFSGCVEKLTDVILGAMELTYDSCLKVLLNPESLQLILSKLPDEVLEKHRKEDRDMGAGIMAGLAMSRGMSVEALVGSFMMIIFGGLYKREVGVTNWRESMRMLIRGIITQLIG